MYFNGLRGFQHWWPTASKISGAQNGHKRAQKIVRLIPVCSWSSRRDFCEFSGSVYLSKRARLLYVHPDNGLLCRTDRLQEEKARRRAARYRVAPPAERIALGEDRELRRIKGLWFEIRLAPLPIPVYRATRETAMRRLTPFGGSGRSFEAEMDVRRLVSPSVRDVVTGQAVAVGPLIDSPEDWAIYRRAQPERRYAVSKRVLARRELRQHGLSNSVR